MVLGYINDDLMKHCLYLSAGTTQEKGRVGACLFLEPEADDTIMFGYSLFLLPTLLDCYKYKATGDMDTLTELAPAGWQLLCCSGRALQQARNARESSCYAVANVL